MPQSSEIKKRIRSVHEIRQITRAMQLVSQVKMKRARDLLERTKPFFLSCVRTMEEMLLESPGALDRVFKERVKPAGATWHVIFYVFGAQQGLAGSYALNVVRFAETLIRNTEQKIQAQGLKFEYEIRFLGKIGKDRLIHDGFNVNQEWSYNIDDPNFYDATDIANNMNDFYMDGTADSIYLVYSTMQNQISAHPIYTRLFPADYQGLYLLMNELFSPAEIAAEEERLDTYRRQVVEFYPDAAMVENYLSLNYVYGMVYGAFTEAFASEQAVRMSAMSQATDNADEILGDLQIEKNRVRQQQITQELSEIISGSILKIE